MKKYLFGLGAMLVGAGLMFVLMHGEVSADSKPKHNCEVIKFENLKADLFYCRFKDITCVTTTTGPGSRLSCVK